MSIPDPRVCLRCDVTWQNGNTCWCCGTAWAGDEQIVFLPNQAGPNKGAIGEALIL